MNDVLGIMVTFTTYGTWLRGDRRGWIDDGRLIAPNSVLEAADRGRLKHPPFRFGRSQLLTVGAVIGRSITTRLQVPLFALHVGTWHVHRSSASNPRIYPRR